VEAKAREQQDGNKHVGCALGQRPGWPDWFVKKNRP
jgi:hypothetical protein